MTNRFYLSKRWKQKRENILRRDKYICRQCKRYGRTTPATLVHHIYPLEHYPEYKLTSINLISLCNTCHEQMHDRATGEIRDIGLVWQRKIEVRLISLEM